MPEPLQIRDFWRVNSYGYPNPFSRDAKSREAWATFLSFYENDQGSYSSLKALWRVAQGATQTRQSCRGKLESKRLRSSACSM